MKETETNSFKLKVAEELLEKAEDDLDALSSYVDDNNVYFNTVQEIITQVRFLISDCE